MKKFNMALIISTIISSHAWGQASWDISSYQTKKLSGDLTVEELQIGDSANSTLRNAICRNIKGLLVANKETRLDGINFKVTKVSADTIDIDFPDNSIPEEAYLKRLISVKADNYCESLVTSNYNKSKNYEMPKNYTYKVRKINGKSKISDLLK